VDNLNKLSTASMKDWLRTGLISIMKNFLPQACFTCPEYFEAVTMDPAEKSTVYKYDNNILN